MTRSHPPTSRTRAVLLLALAATLFFWLLPAGTADAKPPRPGRCLSLSATGTGQDLGGGRTTATIFVRGYPVGTTDAAFTISGVSDGVATFDGEIVFTPAPAYGTLVAPVTGTFDLTSGAFTATSSSVTGTGGLSGVTGSVVIDGVQDLTTGVFTETLRARLCAPVGQHTA